MASPLLIKFTLFVVVCMVLGIVPLGDAATPCGQVQLRIAPCLGYARGPSGGAVSAPCCNRIRTLNSQARTTPDRQGVCRCLKSLAQTVPGLNFQNIASLPAKCGVNLPFKPSPSIDCNKVK